jgi:hypothetical protein
MRKRLVLIAFVVWAAVFLAGAMGELFAIEELREAMDLKRIFLR